MFKTLDKRSIVTFSPQGLYTEFTCYCEVLGTNVFQFVNIRRTFASVCHYSQIFVTFCHYSSLFVTVRDNSSLFGSIRCYSPLFATIRNYSPLFVTIHDYSPLFVTICDYSSLFTTILNIRYLLFATIRYSGFPDTQFKLQKEITSILGPIIWKFANGRYEMYLIMC